MSSSILHKIWRIFLLGLLSLLAIACAANPSPAPEPTSPPATPEPSPTAIVITPTATPVPTALPTATAVPTPEAQLPEWPHLDNGRVDDPTFPEELQGPVTRIELITENEYDRWVAYGLDDDGHEIAYAEYRISEDDAGEWKSLIGGEETAQHAELPGGEWVREILPFIQPGEFLVTVDPESSGVPYTEILASTQLKGKKITQLVIEPYFEDSNAHILDTVNEKGVYAINAQTGLWTWHPPIPGEKIAVEVISIVTDQIIALKSQRDGILIDVNPQRFELGEGGHQQLHLFNPETKQLMHLWYVPPKFVPIMISLANTNPTHGNAYLGRIGATSLGNILLPEDVKKAMLADGGVITTSVQMANPDQLEYLKIFFDSHDMWVGKDGTVHNLYDSAKSAIKFRIDDINQN
jgi:hypothetical protein